MPPQQPMLHVEKFEDLLDRRGREVKWQEAIICSCWNLDSGQPSYSCKACSGKGYVYQAPITAKSAVTSITLNKDFEAMAGVFEVGDAVLTVPKRIPIRASSGQPTGQFSFNPIFEIGLWDKVTLLDDAFKTSEILLRATPMNARPADTLINEDVVSIKSIQTYDAITGVATTYRPTLDYTNVNNLIVWTIGGTSPATGAQYSVVYTHRPTYVVTATLPKPRHQDGQDFPRYVAMRYLAGGVEHKS